MSFDQTRRFAIVDREHISEIVDYTTAFAAVRKALVALDQKNCLLPDQIELQLPRGELHIKGGFLLDSNTLSFKVATGQFEEGGNDGFTIVLDALSGAPLYLIDDSGWLTDMRTGAAGAIATDLLARPDAEVVAVLGTGVQARFQVTALRHLRPGLEFIIWGRNQERARKAADELDATVVESAAEAIRHADAVITVTSSRTPIVFGEWITPGSHVTAVGADMVGKRELDDSVLEAADVIVCDDVTLSARVGELQYRPELTKSALALSGVLTGRLPARRSDDEITIVDLCGLGVEDAAIADFAAQRLRGTSTD